MREILFRGKCGYNNEWVEGFYYRAKLCRSDKELCHYITIPHPESDGQPSDHIMVHPETVGQFTGLTDKNGKKVFENDIIVICYETDGEEFTETKRVHYNEKECCWYPMRWEECCEYCDHYTEVKSIEVIGNIHDNPELLENP